MTVKKATYKVDNGGSYDEVMFKTTADQVVFTDGKTFQDKLNSGELKGAPGSTGNTGPTGPQGPKGDDGLTTSVTVNGTKYVHSNGDITLPNYPTWETIELRPTIYTGDGRLSIRESIATESNGDYSHAEGYYTKAMGDASHSEGYRKTIGKQMAYGRGSHVEGIDNIAGKSTYLATGEIAAHAEGYNTEASGLHSHSEGNSTIASGNYSHAEGYICKALNIGAHAEGANTKAEGAYSHAEGYYTKSTGYESHVEGAYCESNGDYSHAQGHSTIASGYAQTAIGKYNKVDGSATSNQNTDSLFIIGNGTASSSKSNAFRVTWAGLTYAKGAYNSTGADYAEFFEWADGNLDNEERLGCFVTFEKDSEKIRIANNTDDYILGVVSADAAIVGDNYDEDWKNKYLTDKWGRIQYKIKEYPEEVDKEGNIISPAYTTEEPIINPEFLTKNVYVPRKDRPEWDTIGLLGKLLVYNDGTCKIGGYCKPNENGIATKSDTGYRVLDIKEDLVKILFR